MSEQEPKPVEGSPEPPVLPATPRTPEQRLERVVAVMQAEGVDFRAVPIRMTEGMRGTFIADVAAFDIRTGQPLQRG